MDRLNHAHDFMLSGAKHLALELNQEPKRLSATIMVKKEF